MSTFFENLGKKAKEAAQAAAKKSSDLVEVTKLNMNISSEEEKIQKKYLEIGRKIYEEYNGRDNAPEDLTEMFNGINEHMENIEKIRKKIMEIKKIKKCTQCGAELLADAAFCAKCGAKQENKAEDKTAGEDSPGIKCSSCGESISDDSTFCTKCGAKTEEE